MEEIYANAADIDYDKPTPSLNQRGPRRHKRSLGVIMSLGLLSSLLVAGLIILGVHYHATVTNNNQLSSVAQERDQLRASVSEMTKEMKRLSNYSQRKKMCPSGWSMFRCSCYLLSGASASWDEARRDCRARGADLVVVDTPEEQDFVSQFAKGDAWIGLTDKEEEGIWKWVDETPLTYSNWRTDQPDNGNGDPQWGEEDCIYTADAWNDFSCGTSLKWICEKQP
ncbi:CD209 antigen-like protein C [Pholidichthys leucotaenia]